MRVGFCLIAFITLLLCSCDNKRGGDSTAQQSVESDTLLISSKQGSWTFDSLITSVVVHIDDDVSKGGMTSDLLFKYPVSAPSAIDLQKVQAIFKELFSGVDSVSISTPTDVFEKVTEQHRQESEEYGNDFIRFESYYQSLTTEPVTVFESVLVLSKSAYSFLGGAHGNFFIKYENVDLRDATCIKKKNLFGIESENKLTQLLQAKIAHRSQLEDSDEGYISLLVDVKEIKPNDNFFFSKDGLVYVFNQYEIAPYVQGVVEVVIPYKEVLPLVKESYKSLIDDLIKNGNK